MTLWGQIEDWLKPVVRALRGRDRAERASRARSGPDHSGGPRHGTLFDLAPSRVPKPPEADRALPARERSSEAGRERVVPSHRRDRGQATGAPVSTAPAAPKPRPGPRPPAGPGPQAGSSVPSGASALAGASAQDRYDAVTRAMLSRYGIRVRRWRRSMSGVAWEVRYHDGTTARLIEAPKPKGPMSAAIFLHEIGHHAIGFNTYKPRCLEEYHAWAWSIRAMEEHGLAVTDAVRHRMADSLWYAVAKARRRGIKQLPEELMAYTTRPPRRRRRPAR